MGNRAVITTQENWDNNGVGVYLHWHGGRDSVEAFLKYCELKGYRSPDDDCYGWACLVTVISNYFGDGLSVGIDTLNHLDTKSDNGVYIIDGWKIVDRKIPDEYIEGFKEQKSYDLFDIVNRINAKQPKPLDSEDFNHLKTQETQET